LLRNERNVNGKGVEPFPCWSHRRHLCRRGEGLEKCGQEGVRPSLLFQDNWITRRKKHVHFLGVDMSASPLPLWPPCFPRNTFVLLASTLHRFPGPLFLDRTPGVAFSSYQHGGVRHEPQCTQT
jgi:hypothetical protein